MSLSTVCLAQTRGLEANLSTQSANTRVAHGSFNNSVCLIAQILDLKVLKGVLFEPRSESSVRSNIFTLQRLVYASRLSATAEEEGYSLPSHTLGSLLLYCLYTVLSYIILRTRFRYSYPKETGSKIGETQGNRVPIPKFGYLGGVESPGVLISCF